MGFLDIKLIIILFLIIVIFFMYKQIMNIKSGLNSLFLSYRNLENILVNKNKFDNFENIILNENKFNNFENIILNENKFNNFEQVQQITPNISSFFINNETNSSFSNLNDLLDNCIIKTINIPLDTIYESCNEVDIIELNSESEYNEKINIIYKNNEAKIIELNSESECDETVDIIPEYDEIVDEYDETVDIIPEYDETVDIIPEYDETVDKSNETVDKSNETVNKSNETVDKCNKTIDIVPENNQEYDEKYDIINDTSISKNIQFEIKDNSLKNSEISNNHTEVYSNEDSINSSFISTNTQVKTSDNIKDLNKFKLPELQDLAISYKIILQNGNKKKNKAELINDIKKYLLNKNI